ncbi:MAG: alpha-1,4-glucan--maltose-1-phosphate maltosyltransferase [Burkholderiaceae bacterium]
MSAIPLDEGRERAVIESVTPEVDGGRFPIKRVRGESVVVEADAFADGHDVLRCLLRYRNEKDAMWIETDMLAITNDRWRGAFTVSDIGRYRYTVTAWVDHFLSWRHDFARRTDPEDIAIALLIGAQLVAAAAADAVGDDVARLTLLQDALAGERALAEKSGIALSDELGLLMARYPDRRFASDYSSNCSSEHECELVVVVERERARFSSWYEMFPRSAAPQPGRHGTLKDCAARLPYIAAMGFDVLYLPPVHPVGVINRKGKNNVLQAEPDDVGSVWAIGSADGGHKALHHELGTIADFQSLLAQARALDIEIALDIAFQCAPDHPYVQQHPAWYRRRPDGSVQYAENPPKKYQDIYPFDFESDDWLALWHELKSIVEFWIGQGVAIFRVDNPHTKPFAFWEWLIGEIRRDHPEVIFLSEAFTRPKVMHRLAKLGFSQSYTYFTWRNTKHELTAYFTELAHSESREYFRPNCWPNTPDILPANLQFGDRPGFITRLVLAATLCSNYGIYGPAFELIERKAIAAGSEEYKDSEKYQLRHWDFAQPDSLSELIGRVNAIRRANPALQNDWNLRFLAVDNDALLCFGKLTEDLSNIVVVVINLDPHHQQSGWVELDLVQFNLPADTPYQMHDLLSGASYLWNGPRNFVLLDPAVTPAHVFQLRRHLRSERDFDYFM